MSRNMGGIERRAKNEVGCVVLSQMDYLVSPVQTDTGIMNACLETAIFFKQLALLRLHLPYFLIGRHVVPQRDPGFYPEIFRQVAAKHPVKTGGVDHDPCHKSKFAGERPE